MHIEEFEFIIAYFSLLLSFIDQKKKEMAMSIEQGDKTILNYRKTH